MALPFVPRFFLFLFPLMAFYFAHGEDEFLSNCPKGFTCGNIDYLEFPFAQHTQPECGLVVLNCYTTPPTLQLETGGDWYQLQNVTTTGDLKTIFLQDSKLQKLFDTHNCSILNYTVPFRNSPSITFHDFKANTTFLKCNHSVAEHNRNYERHSNCTQGLSLYYKRPSSAPENARCSVPASCIPLPTPIFIRKPNGLVTAQFGLHFEVSEACYDCYYDGGRCTADINNEFQCEKVSKACYGCYYGGGQCTADSNNEFHCAKGDSIARKRSRKLKLILVTGGAALILIFMFILLLCITKKLSFCSSMDLTTEMTNHRNVEEFLQSHGPLAPKRFSYSEVKKITDSFKNELGKGGFGSVYKGKLGNGNLVAVKVLKELETSGEEFINEVASICRTSHVNIVTLIGFCNEGRKRALVYEFMPNGSLEKFIYDNKPLAIRQLGWNMLFKISIGIARGLEYLHRGCNTRILHLDIKPHNILLDEDFSPKISDFGLAKLCTKKESIVSIFGARGTVGYIAPEVICKNIGGVSHKSDVYSYGMMVLEMVGGRRNVDVGVSRNSKIYFPHWIYTRLVLDDELGLIGVMNEEENECSRKMVIVSLWCIQTDPSTRPSMSRVVEMLEGKLEYLQIPPQPYLYSPARSEEQHSSPKPYLHSPTECEEQHSSSVFIT